MDFAHTRILLLAIGIVFLNATLRLSTRFVAAMGLRLVSLLHPILVLPPVVLLIYHFTCFVAPLCGIAKYFSGFGKRLYDSIPA